MRTWDHYPFDSVKGGCFVLGRYEVPRGEKVLDLDIDMDSLPQFGRLCLSEAAVRCMVVELGWELLTPQLSAHLDSLQSEVDDLRAQLDELSDAMVGMVDVPAVRAALEVVARRVAGKDSVGEWLETLPKVGR